MWHVWGERCVEGFGVETLGGRGHFEGLGVDRGIIVEWILLRIGASLWVL